MLEFTEGQTIMVYGNAHILRARGGKVLLVMRAEVDGLPETSEEFRDRIRRARAKLDQTSQKTDTTEAR